jgi:hypothetical protein
MPAVRDSAHFVKFRCDDAEVSVLLNIEPLTPVKRLCILLHYSSSRLSPNVGSGSVSRSLLSRASSSWYSLNTTGGGFATCSLGWKSGPPDLALQVVPRRCPLLQHDDEINHCACAFCKHCVKSYIGFEI